MEKRIGLTKHIHRKRSDRKGLLVEQGVFEIRDEEELKDFERVMRFKMVMK